MGYLTRQEGLEPPTRSLEGCRSIQLSYWRGRDNVGRIEAMTKRLGFTLLELMIVVLIIGILAAIAIPKFGSTKDRAYVATMKSDLRNLVTAEESYFADYASYTTNLSQLSIIISPAVTLTITSATGTGWDATASYNASTKTCGIFVGTGTPPLGSGNPGEAVCS